MPRFYIGHRLPGGFYGGMGVGSYRRRHAPVAAAANSSGCALLVFLGIIAVVLVLTIEYWYISVPVIAVLTAVITAVVVLNRKPHAAPAASAPTVIAAPAPAPATPVARPRVKAADKPDVVEELESLAKLHADGAITDSEFAAAKQRLLSG